jgi:hypothetical protein
LNFSFSNVSAFNFAKVLACARAATGANGKPIEVVVTLNLDIPVWKKATQAMDKFGPVVVAFLQKYNLDGMNFDWEDNVDTAVYMKLLSGLRTHFDNAAAVTAGAAGAAPSAAAAALPPPRSGRVAKKHYLITVAPGWPQYAWDASAIGVVDAFDMMSYANDSPVEVRCSSRSSSQHPLVSMINRIRTNHEPCHPTRNTLLSQH